MQIFYYTCVRPNINLLLQSTIFMSMHANDGCMTWYDLNCMVGIPEGAD